MLQWGLSANDGRVWTRARVCRWLPGLLGALAIAMVAQVSSAAAATFTVTTTADSGAGSLRQAITDVNAGGTGHTIAFAIPGPGPHVIAPASALPPIQRDGTTIDGCTQPGSDCGGLPLSLQVRLDGQGFSLTGFGVTIRGFSFTGANAAVSLNRVARDGVFQLPDDVTIEHNYVGLAPDGSAAGKTLSFQLQPGNRSLTNPLERLRIVGNVIGSNAGTAINATAQAFSVGRPLTQGRISGNIIGLDPTGTQPRPNGGDGIAVDISSDMRIVGNIVANNTGVGIRHRGRTQTVPGSDPTLDPGLLIQGNVVEGNAGGGIALAPDDPIIVPASADPYSGPVNLLGNTIRNNGVAGVTVTAAAETLRPNLRIGGTAPGEANTISGNDGPGVAVGPDTSDTSIAVTVRGNAIFANSGPAIDLASDGPTDNADPLVARTGPNLLVNHPVIDSIAHGSVIINGTYAGAANATYTLDFYKSETADGPQTWIGTTTITTGADGTAGYSAEFEPDAPEGWLIHATATDADGSTSELGAAAAVPPVPPAPITPSPGPPSSPAGPSQDAPRPQPITRERRQPKLRLSQSVDRRTLRAGQTATYTFRLRNPSRRAVHDVRVCTKLPAGLVRVRSTPRPSLANGRYCWTAKSVAAAKRKTYKLTVRALAGASGRKVSRAVARSADARTTRARSAIRVLAGAVDPGGVTG
jgi:uncharacterized repeat protein (TIGR01451 family)